MLTRPTLPAHPPGTKLLYVSPRLIAVSKPPGLCTLSDGPNLLDTLRQLQDEGNLPHVDGRLFPVHRLDRVTSGTVLFARDPDTAGELVSLFRSKKILKYYVALSPEKPTKKMGTIKGDLVKSRGGTWRLARTTEDPAVTRFVSVSLHLSVPSSDPAGAAKSLRMFVLRPETGKTHQLRVAMKSLGAPVWGDEAYGGGGGGGADRVYLHSSALSLTLETGEAVRILDLPTEGTLFQSGAFQTAFRAVFGEEGAATALGLGAAEGLKSLLEPWRSSSLL
jgi:tRNA pseudouridine32 synthase / 23S rRNA pseudouridine746 synthase